MSQKLAQLRREVFGPPPAAEDELAALWSQVFGQPPPVIGAPRLLASVLIRSLPPAPPYEPNLPAQGRPSNVTRLTPARGGR
jgi:hypothetical protein